MEKFVRANLIFSTKPMHRLRIMNNIDLAIEQMVKHFRGITRRGGAPYSVHPMLVMYRLCTWGIKDEDVLVTAIHHDTVEDPNQEGNWYNAEDIRRDFGDAVHDDVMMLTFSPSFEHGTKEYREDKRMYLTHVADHGTIEALVVKLADRICNVEDFRLMKGSYHKKYKKKAAPLFSAFRRRKEEFVVRFGKETYKRIESEIGAKRND